MTFHWISVAAGLAAQAIVYSQMLRALREDDFRIRTSPRSPVARALLRSAGPLLLVLGAALFLVTLMLPWRAEDKPAPAAVQEEPSPVPQEAVK